MAELTAEQIIERLAIANGIDSRVMRQHIEKALQAIIADTNQPHSLMLKELFPKGNPTVDELVVALEQELYEAMMPKIPGWEWDGYGYRNIRLLGKKHKNNGLPQF